MQVCYLLVVDYIPVVFDKYSKIMFELKRVNTAR